MRTRTINLAFVGAGNIARQHLAHLSQFPDTRIVGFCDIDTRSLRFCVDKYGGTGYVSVATMLQHSHPDAVFICLPPHAHGDAEFACASLGIPFFVEKPVSSNLQLARAVLQAVDAAGVTTSVGYMNRYRRGVAAAKAQLAGQHVALVHGAWFDRTPDGPPWLLDAALSGGQLLEQATHLFDIIRYLCGEVESVFAVSTQFASQPRCVRLDTATAITLLLRSGATATVMCSWTRWPTREIYLRVRALDLCLAFTGWSFDLQGERSGNAGIAKLPGEDQVFSLEDRAFIDAVRDGDSSRILCDYADGVRTLEVSIACQQSVRVGMPIQLPLT